MAENGTSLSRNEMKAIRALLTEATIKDAAKAAGLGERTINRYLRDPDFRAELRRRQDEIIAATSAALVGLSGDMVAELHRIVHDENASASVKARVALGWLQQARDTVELHSLAERVAALEERLGL